MRTPHGSHSVSEWEWKYGVVWVLWADSIPDFEKGRVCDQEPVGLIACLLFRITHLFHHLFVMSDGCHGGDAFGKILVRAGGLESLTQELP